MSGKPKIIVVGAGASGMVAAIEASKRGIEVTVLEASEKAGKKIYVTGNGRCNLTNRVMDVSCYNGTDREFIAQVLKRFGCGETLGYFSKLGLMFKDRGGYIYPLSGQASSVAECLVQECERLDIKILCNVTAERISIKNSKYRIQCVSIEQVKSTYTADGIILACGSPAGISANKCPAVSGYSLAGDLGHDIVPIVPALTGIRCKNTAFYKRAAGVRCDGTIALYEEDKSGRVKKLAEDTGELQLTDYGISGIPAFQVSRHAACSIRSKSVKNTFCDIDFLPSVTKEELKAALNSRIMRNKSNTILQYFNGIVNSKLAKAVISDCGVAADKTGESLKPRETEKITERFKHFHDSVTGVNDFRNAQAAAGGVPLTKVSRNMESVYQKNLYITGEMLDADGICGGYNLQWAWATGYIAGNSIL